MAGFYNHFIPNLSGRAAALMDKVGSRFPNRLQWYEEARMAFNDIQNALGEEPLLHNPESNKSLIVQTDALDH